MAPKIEYNYIIYVMCISSLILLSSCSSPDLEITSIEFKTLDRSSNIYVEKGSVQGPVAVVISASGLGKKNGMINPYIEVGLVRDGTLIKSAIYPYLRGTKTVGDSLDSIVILLNDGLPLENGVYTVEVTVVDENRGRSAKRTETLNIP